MSIDELPIPCDRCGPSVAAKFLFCDSADSFRRLTFCMHHTASYREAFKALGWPVYSLDSYNEVETLIDVEL